MRTMFKHATRILFSVLLVASAGAQSCNRWHPEGADNLPMPRSMGCNEITGGQAPFFSLWRGLEALPSQDVAFKWVDVPYVDLLGFISLSTGYIPEPVQLPGFPSGCMWQVTPGVMLPVVVPRPEQGCHVYWLFRNAGPSLVGLQGLQFYCQSVLVDNLNRKLVTNPFVATIL